MGRRGRHGRAAAGDGLSRPADCTLPRQPPAAPDNWTCRRQAWTFADPAQGPTAQYDGDWLSDVRRVGAENYYAQVELEPRRG